MKFLHFSAYYLRRLLRTFMTQLTRCPCEPRIEVRKSRLGLSRCGLTTVFSSFLCRCPGAVAGPCGLWLDRQAHPVTAESFLSKTHSNIDQSAAGFALPGGVFMATDIRLKESLPDITEALVATYTECSRINHLGHKPLPSREAIVDILADLLDILYPGYGRRQNLHIGNIEFHVGDVIDGLHDKLTQQIARALRHEHCQENHDGDIEALAQQKAIELLKRLPDVRARLELDAQAAFEGDPAAKSFPE